MGYKSKLKQLKRQQQDNFSTNDWAKDLNIITIDANDNNWLFRSGIHFDSNAKLIHQGSLDSCIDIAYTVPLALEQLASDVDVDEDCAESNSRLKILPETLAIVKVTCQLCCNASIDVKSAFFEC